MNAKRGFIISAPASATGKTTVALGLMRALVEDHRSVAPFKTGPDYIDTQYHTVACGRPSVNLDTYFTPGDRLSNLFSRYVSPDDIAVVEGAMGLFDGYDRDRGSSADVARTLGLPVVLVVNAKSVSYSLAPILSGFRNFDPSVRISGVIFNRVGSEKHRAMIASAAADVGVEVMGAIPMSADLALPSRHLGLSLSDREDMDAFIAGAARIVRENVDLERIAALSYESILPSGGKITHTDAKKHLNISVARDMAFSFIYPTTVDAISSSGTVKYFSPLAGEILPADTDILYLPGGYPELFASQLSENAAVMESIRKFAVAGGRIFAECGGLIYLCEAIVCDGRRYPMCGVLPMTATMENARLRLGYRELSTDGLILRGHEFHYSRLIGDDNALRVAVNITDALGRSVDTALYRKDNVIAGYTHLFLGDTDITKLWNL